MYIWTIILTRNLWVHGIPEFGEMSTLSCPSPQENYRMGGAYQWPEIREVMEYRRTVKELVTDLINSAPLELPVTTDHPWVRRYGCRDVCTCIQEPQVA